MRRRQLLCLAAGPRAQAALTGARRTRHQCPVECTAGRAKPACGCHRCLDRRPLPPGDQPCADRRVQARRALSEAAPLYPARRCRPVGERPAFGAGAAQAPAWRDRLARSGRCLFDRNGRRCARGLSRHRRRSPAFDEKNRRHQDRVAEKLQRNTRALTKLALPRQADKVTAL